jgi:hypothetical protein
VCGPTVMTVLPVAPPRPGARCCDSKQTSHPSSCARLARVCLSLTACKDNAVVCALLVGRWGGGGAVQTVKRDTTCMPMQCADMRRASHCSRAARVITSSASRDGCAALMMRQPHTGAHVLRE